MVHVKPSLKLSNLENWCTSERGCVRMMAKSHTKLYKCHLRYLCSILSNTFENFQKYWWIFAFSDGSGYFYVKDSSILISNWSALVHKAYCMAPDRFWISECFRPMTLRLFMSTVTRPVDQANWFDSYLGFYVTGNYETELSL